MTILCFDTGLMSYQPEDLYCVVLENEETVSAEQYLVGILAQEIDPSMEQETLKAQAILARTWLYRAKIPTRYCSAETVSSFSRTTQYKSSG